MKEFFFDTSIQAVRLFYPEENRKQVENIFKDVKNYNLLISRYSWFEFYHTWFNDLRKIMLAGFESRDLEELIANLSITQENAKRIFTALASIMKGTDRSPKAISGRAFSLLKNRLKIAYYDFNGKVITEVDHLSCNILDKIINEFDVYEEMGVPKIRFVDPYDTCSIERANCKIDEYVSSLIDDLKLAIEGMEKNEGKKDDKFIKKGKIIAETPKKAKGKTCLTISDWLMITESPKNSTLVTTDEDWSVIAKALNRECIKIPIQPRYDKNSVRKKIMTEV